VINWKASAHALGLYRFRIVTDFRGAEATCLWTYFASIAGYSAVRVLAVSAWAIFLRQSVGTICRVFGSMVIIAVLHNGHRAAAGFRGCGHGPQSAVAAPGNGVG